MKLTRATLGARRQRDVPAAPVRIVHIGLGAFARAHQAYYTARVDESNEWGIAGFTGRSSTVADELTQQDGLFTLVERSSDSDLALVVTSVVEVWDGSRLDRLVGHLASPNTALITLTITESGYRLTPQGLPDLHDPAVTRDVALIRAGLAAGRTVIKAETALGRVLVGLSARRHAHAGPIAIVPCDNMPDNGAFVRQGLGGLAQLVDPQLVEWIDTNVAFVATSVDRITPRTTAETIATVERLTGWIDAEPVVAEPFHDWVLCGAFPRGRPEWERAGAHFVESIEPFERRKLWLLNAAHSLLAYAGLRRGYTSVAEAIVDQSCRSQVLALWQQAARHLPTEGLDLEAYCAALITRFENVRIEHRLSQIASDGVTKLRVRLVTVTLAERAAGRHAKASAIALGSWISLVIHGFPLADAQRDSVLRAAAAPDPVRELVALIDDELAEDAGFVTLVREVVADEVPLLA